VTHTIDKLFLELSQFTRAKTRRELDLETDNTRLRDAVSKQQHEIEQTLGKALRYPKFCDDQKNFPGSTEADGVIVGEHVAETLAAEAAAEIVALRTLLIQQYDSNIALGDSVASVMPKIRETLHSAKAEVHKALDLEQLVRNLLNDVADRYKIFKAAQFTCPHMRALAEAVFPNGDVIRK